MSTQLMKWVGRGCTVTGILLLLTVIPVSLHSGAVIAGASLLLYLGAYVRFIAGVPDLVRKAKEQIK